MNGNPWTDRILQELLRLQTRTEDSRYRPVGLLGLRLSMLSDANPVNTIAWEDAVRALEQQGLIEVRGGRLVELSDEGWRYLGRGVPGGERDEPFLAGLLGALQDDAAPKNKRFISARDVYKRLGWRWDTGEAHALADRLQRRGLATASLTNGDALIQLTLPGKRQGERLEGRGVNPGV